MHRRRVDQTGQRSLVMTKKLGTVLGLAGVLVILVPLTRIAPAQAGGGRDYKVTVQNTSGYTCQVALYGLENGVASAFEQLVMANGSTHTFQSNKCPIALVGSINAWPPGWRDIRTTCLLTGRYAELMVCMNACSDSSWTICRKEGTNPANINSDDFGFFKK